MEEQMELFEDGGLYDEGGMADEVSGNDVPVGSTREEVRDDIPAMLSEGEFVLPADVVRYHGLEKIMQLRDEAKFGLRKMEAMGQMGNSDEATMPDDVPFSSPDLMILSAGPENEEVKEMAEGGMATGISGFQQSIYAGQQPSSTYTPPPSSVAPPTPTPAPSGGFLPRFVDDGSLPREMVDQINQLENQQTDSDLSGTSTAATPITETDKFVPTVEDKYTSLKYINPETGQIREFYFYNGNPVTPIPDGFIPYDESVDEVVDDLESTTVETTQVRGSDDDPFKDLPKPEAVDYSKLSTDELLAAFDQNKNARLALTAMGVVNPMIALFGRFATGQQQKNILAEMEARGMKVPETKGNIIDRISDMVSGLFGADKDEVKKVIEKEKDGDGGPTPITSSGPSTRGGPAKVTPSSGPSTRGGPAKVTPTLSLPDSTYDAIPSPEEIVMSQPVYGGALGPEDFAPYPTTSSSSSGPSTRGRPTPPRSSSNDDKPSFAPAPSSSSSSSAGKQTASQKASTAAATQKAKETLTSGQRAGSAALDKTYGISGLKSGGLASRKKKK